MSYNKFSDLEGIPQLPCLKVLDLGANELGGDYHNGIKVSQVSILSNYPSLEELEFQQCNISQFDNFPNLDTAFLEVRYQDNLSEEISVEEALRLAILKRYKKYFNSDIELPGDSKIYLVEVTIPKVDEQSDQGNPVRVYDSNSQLIWPIPH